MFYIKTADPLTRTATWLNKMEGGIDYLRNVVMNDSLGIGAQWEIEMQALVDSLYMRMERGGRESRNSEKGFPIL